MFIRKKVNKGGSTSVLLVRGERVPDKKHPILKVVKNFGASTSEVEIERLVVEAEKYKNQVESIFPQFKMLKVSTSLDVKSCRSHNVGFADIYGHFFSSVFGLVPFKEAEYRKLRDLVTLRIANPCSKRKTAMTCGEYGIELAVDSIYKFMDCITSQKIDETKKIIYKHTQAMLAEKKQTIDVLFYDLTTIYFETGTQDEVRNFGFSKDGKHQHVQIMLAVIVTKEGLPIDYEEFPGNTYEGHTLLPVLHKIRERYQIDKTVIVADAALMNKINLQELDAYDIEYIIAARLKNSKKEVKKLVLDLSNYSVISSSTNSEDGSYDQVCAKSIPCDTGDYIFAYHSTRRARKDAFDREKDLEKIRKHLNSTAKSKLTGSLKKSYVKISKDCKIEIDQEKLELESQYDGFFGLRTNIKDAHPGDILIHYRGLWQVEQTFRIAKSNLEIRPVFHFTPRRIRAHFLICYMALALIRYVEFTLKMNGVHIPPEQLYLLLNRMRKVCIIDANNHSFEFLEDPPPELLAVYQALKIQWPEKFQYLPKL